MIPATTRTALGRLARAAALAALLAPAAAPLRAQAEIPFDSVPAEPLEVPIPGVAVVRDSARWVTFWHRFARKERDEAGRIRRIPPPVDFRRHMLVVIAGQATSGCSNQATFVRRVVERRDSIEVHLGPDLSDRVDVGDQVFITCMAIIHPVEVIRLRRSSRPVAFRGNAGFAPVPAPWWHRPSMAELDRMSDRDREAYTGALVRDPGTPAATIAAIAQRLTRDDWNLIFEMLERPDVVREPRIVGHLASLGGDAGRYARVLLFDRPQLALALARDPRTPVPVLRVLLDELNDRHPPPADVSRALARHPGILADRDLLRRLVGRLRPHPAIHAEACRAYLARYPVWGLATDGAGKPIPGAWSAAVSCPGMPPHPSAQAGDASR